MSIEVFLLALDVAVHDDAAIIAVDLAWREADRTYGEVRAYILSCSDFIGDEILVVHCIRIGSELHEELSYILSTTHRSEVQRCITIIVSNVWLSTVLKKQL